MLLNEIYLKCSFLEHFRRLNRLDGGSVLASEFSLGRAGRRIDLAIWNGEFIGVEFKSKFDTLKRLSSQLDAYLQCFDRIIFVVDQKHISKVAALLPAAVELWVVGPTGNFVLKNPAGVLRGQTTEAPNSESADEERQRGEYDANSRKEDRNQFMIGHFHLAPLGHQFPFSDGGNGANDAGANRRRTSIPKRAIFGDFSF